MGGKSRKTGGVSAALIARIKAGEKSSSGGTKKPKSDEQDTIFGKG